MPTLGSLPAHKPELRLTFAAADAPKASSAEVTGVVTLTPEELLEDGVPTELPQGSLVLVTGTASFQLRGRIVSLLGQLLQHMSTKGSVALAVFAAPGARPPFPPDIVKGAARYRIPLLVTSAPAEIWQGVHEDIQHMRLLTAERRAAQLSSLLQELPAQLADPCATQRVADWLSRALGAQVLVSGPDRVLACAPDTAAEVFARAGLRQSGDSVRALSPTGPHIQMISLAPSAPTDTVLAILRETAFDTADIRLLRHAAKLLGLVDQASRDYRAASDAARAARNAALELLLQGEVAKARRVMSNLLPGLLHADTARIYVIETQPERQEIAAQRCMAAVGGHALVASDPQSEQRLLIVQPVSAGQELSGPLSDELTCLVRALGPKSSLGGSRIYAMNRLAEALHEALMVQRYASLQPDSVALSVHDSELIALLPQHGAQQWAQTLLAPLMRDSQWDSLRTKLPTALAFPKSEAAGRLNLHRNTVARLVKRAADLLRMDLGGLGDRIVAAMAMELLTRRGPTPPVPPSSEPLRLTDLLASPAVKAWAEALLNPVLADPRNLLATANTWLRCDAHVEPCAKELGLSEVTVRGHLRALSEHTRLNIMTFSGVRDLMFSLHAACAYPLHASSMQNPLAIV